MYVYIRALLATYTNTSEGKPAILATHFSHQFQAQLTYFPQLQNSLTVLCAGAYFAVIQPVLAFSFSALVT